MKLRTIISLVALFTATVAATAQKIPAGSTNAILDWEKEIAWSDNERLTYAVSYKAPIAPALDAGEVVMRTSRTTVNSIPAYNIFATGKVYPSYKKIFDLEDTYQSWLGADNLKPIKYQFRLREGNYRANCDYTYDWANGKVKTRFHNLKKEPVDRSLNLSKHSFDALALFYNLRCIDMTKLSQGTSHNLQMVLDDKIRTVTFRYLGKEQKKVGKTGTFNTLKFSCTIAISTDSESFEDGSVFYLWISDDKNRIPVYLESPIKIGSVRVTLTAYQNLKHTLSSKVK